MITYDDFSKVEMKVGKILEVLDHPDADKLYVLKVEIGSQEPIQLVAGIKPYYDKDSIINKHIVVLTNLQPRMLRGVESQGMLLAAQGQSEVVVLTVDKEVAPGSGIR